jgi:hypothetical protein
MIWDVALAMGSFSVTMPYELLFFTRNADMPLPAWAYEYSTWIVCGLLAIFVWAISPSGRTSLLTIAAAVRGLASLSQAAEIVSLVELVRRERDEWRSCAEQAQAKLDAIEHLIRTGDGNGPATVIGHLLWTVDQTGYFAEIPLCAACRVALSPVSGLPACPKCGFQPLGTFDQLVSHRDATLQRVGKTDRVPPADWPCLRTRAKA